MTYPNVLSLSNRDLDAEILRREVPRTFQRTNTTDMMSRQFPPIKWVVPGYISEGFLVLAGRQKLGKTWLAIDWALAVAVGGVAMGSIPCEEGDVLYIDMENGPRRIQSRINTLFPDERKRPDLTRLEWVTEAPPLDAGFIGELENWRQSVPAPRLIVIDVLQRIKPPGSMARNAYENDYSTWAPLQHWATQHGIAVLGLHHTKKGGADDPLEALSGSNGLSACADTTLVLDSDQNGKTLYVRGRDVEEKETALLFAGGAWTLLGEAADIRRSGERNKIIAALEDHGSPMAPAEIAAATGEPGNNVRRLLMKMAKAAEVHKVGGSRYWLGPVPPGNAGNSGNASIDPIGIVEQFEDNPVTDVEETDNSGNSDDVFEAKLVELGFYGPIDPDQNSVGTSNRYKCWQCHERGETLEVHYGRVQARLHRACIHKWTSEYSERNGLAGSVTAVTAPAITGNTFYAADHKGENR